MSKQQNNDSKQIKDSKQTNDSKQKLTGIDSRMPDGKLKLSDHKPKVLNNNNNPKVLNNIAKLSDHKLTLDKNRKQIKIVSKAIKSNPAIKLRAKRKKKRTNIRMKNNSPSETNAPKKLKVTSSTKLNIDYASFTSVDVRSDSRGASTSRSGSPSSVGSVLSLFDAADSDTAIIDFECRTIDFNQFCLRKNKSINYRSLFKRPGFADFDLRKDDLIGKQYKVVKLMGKGTFSNVYLCQDTIANKEIALKIFTQRHQVSLVKAETQIALYLKKLDPNDTFNFVKMLDLFRCRNQFFIVYESLSLSLYDYMAKVRKKGYTVKEICPMSKQICLTMEFLHRNKVIHTDIKPENILFVDAINKEQLTSLKIKMVDFGSSILNATDSSKNFGTVTTRHYRAPEVLMRLPWSYPIDVFSVGVTVFELYTQVLLFPSVSSNLQHFIIMTATLGQLPSMYQTSKPHYFSQFKNLNNDEIKKYKPFEKYFNLKDEETKQFYKFLRRMLVYDPSKRATFKEIISDPFIKDVNI